MRLPAMSIVAAFAAGIALLGAAPVAPVVWITFAVGALLLGFGAFARQHLRSAFALSLVAWFCVGALAARVDSLAVPQDHITRLLSNARLDTSEPLRWRGTLRSDPLRLPWGWRYEIELDEVEAAGAPVRVKGGLRANLYREAQSGEAPPAVRAGDRVEALVRARTPRNFMNPGAFDARAYLARQGIHLTGSLRSAELLRPLPGPGPNFVHRLARMRGRLLEQVDTMFAGAPEQGAIVKAMVLGDKSFVDRDVAEAFQKTSVYHVLVVSGLHVTALAAFVYFLGRLIRLPRWMTLLAVLAVLPAFVAIVEDRPPIERAALMAAVFLFSQMFYRRVDLLNTISVAAVIVLALRPSSLGDPSSQLSFLAVGIIGALALPWAERTSAPYRRGLQHLDDITRDASHPPRVTQLRIDLRSATQWVANRVPKRLSGAAPLAVTLPLRAGLRAGELVVVSTIIQFGMLPVMAYYFHRVALSGPLANIPALVLSGLIVPMGFVASGASALWTPLGILTTKILGALVSGLLIPVNELSRWGWASYRIPEPPVWLMAVFFVLLVLLAAAVRQGRARRQWLAAAPVVFCAIAIAVFPFAPRLTKGELEVAVLDVGQGDSVFVAYPDGRTMLVDGGGSYGASRVGGMRTGIDIGEEVVSPYLWSRGIKQIDAVALTHAHQDHIDGLDAVLANFRVKELWVGRDVDSAAFRALLARAEARGVRIVHKRRGGSIDWSGVTGMVLWPEENTLAPAPVNNDSLVLRLEYGATSTLLPGDIEAKVEAELVERGDPLNADILKVPHHGSRTSSTAAFLAAVTPQTAVVSFGENNPFGHPHREVMERLQRSGARVFRTDRDGAVTALSDGRTWRISSYAREQHR